MQRRWEPEKAKEAVLVGTSMHEGKSASHSFAKSRSRPDQIGPFVDVAGDDSDFPAEETEDTER